MTRILSLFLLVALIPVHARQAPEKSGAPAEKKWDVAADLGPTTKLAFDTSEGTWMNVDVSPDGRRIVFDLLGDLYVMPIGGSGTAAAERLTSGPAFDMQPRFSPDGTRVAFSSDRDGLWNIWTMAADGKDARQVSKEKRWFVNSPAWSPDGQFIFARRHFVKERSLGAGEIWMFHANGADGLQVTEKNGFQKDAGEPAVSADGRYLYYSKDVTPGQTFEYNKDPNGLIYAIFQRDLATGRERRIVSVQGGSVTPRPSPDGKSLAFIRRVRLQSRLYVRDLDTGQDRVVFEHLDKDLQEAWAVHGLYPQYAWTPDGSAIVIWGEGKIWRAGVSGGAPAVVPFTARVEQTLNEAVRSPRKVHAPEFAVRMLRDVAVSPDGSKAAYNALGRIYVRPLPSGEPKPVTPGDALAFDPAWSPDGQSLVYTTWTDAGYGRVRVMKADGTGGREVVAKPGHYTEPAFSRDGKQIVFRNAGPDEIRGHLHGVQPGVYVVPADGGTPRLVAEAGTQPMFDETGRRVYLFDRRGEKFVLLSVGLGEGTPGQPSKDEVVHVQSDNATQIVPSPDGRWIAFEERFHTYVAPFARTGRTIDLAPGSGAYPTARVSRDAGAYLHWSGDSRKVYWTLGPDLFTRDLARTFTFLDRNLEKPDEPETKGLPIGFNAKTDVPEGAIAFVGARILTMAGEPGAAGARGREAAGVIENGTLVVEGNRITAVGRSGAVAVPAGAKRIDASGRTIMPGLIDVHAHVRGEGHGILAQSSWPLMANLAFGVTTAHDPSNDTETVFSNAELIRAGAKLGPRLFSTGTILYGAETPYKAVIETYEDALSHLRRQKAAGAFSVKSYNQQRRDVRQMILKAARELDMLVVPEGGSLLYMNETMVLDGHTGIEHSLPVPRIYKDVVTLFGKSRVGYTPTMIVGYGGLSGEYYWYQEANVWEHERLLRFTPRAIVDARSRRRQMTAQDDFNHVLIGKGAKQILDAGGLVQLGAHGQLQGLGAHWELWMLQQGGMTPMEALRAGTINGAKYLGLDGELGSLEKGKLADLIVLERSPLENIRNSERISLVMVNGRLYDAKTLNEVGNRETARPPFWFEGQ